MVALWFAATRRRGSFTCQILSHLPSTTRTAVSQFVKILVRGRGQIHKSLVWYSSMPSMPEGRGRVQLCHLSLNQASIVQQTEQLRRSSLSNWGTRFLFLFKRTTSHRDLELDCRSLPPQEVTSVTRNCSLFPPWREFVRPEMLKNVSATSPEISLGFPYIS